MRVFRYSIEPPKTGFETIMKLPKGAQILTAQIKTGEKVPSIWVMVDPNQPLEDRVLLILPTGVDIPHHWKVIRYIDTVQIMYSDEEEVLCFHIFEQSID